MSNYLNYLAVKSLDLTSSIQPRLPGPFETLQSVAGTSRMDTRNEMEVPDDKFVTDVQPLPWLSHSPVEPASMISSLDETTSAASRTLPILNPKTHGTSTGQVSLSHHTNPFAAPGPEQEDTLPGNKPLPLASESIQQRNSPPEPLLPANTAMALPRHPEKDPDVSGSFISPEQEGADTRPLSFLERLETKLISEVVRAPASVEPSRLGSRQPNTGIVSSKQISMQHDKMESAALPANSTKKQESQTALLESGIEIIEKPSPSAVVSGPITVEPFIKPVSLPEPGRSQKSTIVSAQPSEAPPEPIVHVTIGRIEVRATPLPQIKRETPSKLPTMGLDEYLKQFGSKQ